jgi:hypothetical protein
MNNIFNVLNWIFKTNKKAPDKNENISIYMLNRWITMANVEFANLINLTTNRWASKKLDVPYYKFLYSILPKHNKTINYIKKTSDANDETLEDIKILSDNLELSTREIKFLENTLAEFEVKTK